MNNRTATAGERAPRALTIATHFASRGRFAVLAGLAVCLAAGSARAQGDYRKGVSYFQQNQYNKAIAEFEPIVEEQKNYEFGHRILGFCYLKTRQYDKAIRSLREAIRLKDNNFSTYRALALAYFNAGRYKDVLPTLDKAETLARAPRDKYAVYRTRGAAAFNAGNYSRAAADLEKAVLIQRGNADDALQLGISYFRLNQPAKAEQYLQQALALNPQNKNAARFLSQLQYREAVDAIEAGRYQEAAKTLRDFVDRRPDDAEAWFNLGLAYLFAESYGAAEESFLRVVKLTPDNGEAHDRLGYLYEKKKRYRKALESYQKAFKLTQKETTRESVERIRKRLAQQSG